MASNLIERTAFTLVRQAGAVLLRYFGRIRNVREKEHPSSVVCDADLASEEYLVSRIRCVFPDHSIIAEESGYSRGTSEYTWVIDPLDGTSNFVAGLPWFGVQLGVLRDSIPIFTAMYLPVEADLYHAAAGRGAYKNRTRLRVTAEPQIKNVLCAFGFDASAGLAQARRDARLLVRVARGVRNTRATNSLVDFCYTLEGHLGGCVNLNCKIWDIVPVSLMLPEAGGIFSDLRGRSIRFELDDHTVERSYAVLGASKRLHRQLVRLLGS
jgi:myo-inositol-1(or 4)-monophosphatase